MNRSSEDQAQQECLPNSVAGSPLFGLPPEIRNIIYRFAPIADDDLVVTKTHGIPEAALLSVNKLVRSETYKLFYAENVFTCVVFSFDCAPLVLACRKFSGSLQFSNINIYDAVTIVVTGNSSARNWKNLVTWAHCCHRCVCCGPEEGFVEPDAEHTLVLGLFQMVAEGPNITTRALGFLLKSLRPAFVKLHQDWAKD
jgi:hypothetical protein